jgi:hypothetical protein
VYTEESNVSSVQWAGLLHHSKCGLLSQHIGFVSLTWHAAVTTERSAVSVMTDWVTIIKVLVGMALC